MLDTKRLKYKIISFILIVAICITCEGIQKLVLTKYPASIVFAADEKNKYLKEVKIFQGKNAGDVKQNVIKSGYKVLDQDMNEGAGGKCTYLGYKLTSDESDAITDLKILGENTGYAYTDYGSIIDQNYKSMEPVADELVIACEEYGRQFNAGSPAAVFANASLNIYYYEEDGERFLLGDYLAQPENVNSDMMYHLITRGSDAVVSAVMRFVAIGVANYERVEQTTWLNELSNNGMIEHTGNRAKKEWRGEDDIYYDSAVDFKDTIIKYAESVTEAKDYASKQPGGKIDLSEAGNSDKTTEDYVKEASKTINKRVEDGDIEVKDKDKEKAYAFFLLAHEEYKQFEFECPAYGTHNVGDYIVSLGLDLKAHQEEDINVIRNAYPLIRDLSPGQFAMSKMCGLERMVTSAQNTRKSFSENYDSLDELYDFMKENKLGTSISVWNGVDTDIYNQRVAFTDDAIRNQQAGLNIDRDRRTALDKAEGIYNQVNFWLGFVSSVATFVWLAAMLTTQIVFGTTALFALYSSAIAYGLAYSSVASVVAGVIGCASSVLGWIAIAIVIIMIVFMIGWEIGKAIGKYIKKKKGRSYDKDAIPREIYDCSDTSENGKFYYERYNVVSNNNGDPGDVNGYDKDLDAKWNVMYYTKSLHAGKPIIANDLGQIFKVAKNSSQSDYPGYRPVALFGSDYPADLTADVNGDYSIHIHYHAGGEEEKVPTRYVSAIAIYQGMKDDANDLKDKLRRRGYTVVDENLGESKYSVYFGYKTTKNEDNAVRDIRVSINNATTSFKYGDYSYTLAGETANSDEEEGVKIDGGIIGGRSSLCYSKSKGLGDAVIPSFKVTNEPLAWDNEEGWEPVCTMSGGNPYDFGSESKQYLYMVDEVTDKVRYITYTSNNYIYEGGADGYNIADLTVQPKYLYYKTTHNYNKDEDKKTYISGILSAGGYFGNKVEDYCASKSWPYNNSEESRKPEFIAQFTKDKFYSTIGAKVFDTPLYKETNKESQDLLYTLTHNPNRALYDIRTYESISNNVPASIIKNNVGYFACEAYLQGDPKCYSGDSDEENYARGKVKEDEWDDGWDGHAHPTEIDRTYAKFHSILSRFNTPSRAMVFKHDDGDYNTNYNYAVSNCTLKVDGKQATDVGMFVTGKTGKKSPILFEDVKLTTQKKDMDGYIGVGTITNDFNNQPYNLSFNRSESEPIYMYRKGSVPNKDKYITKISVGSGSGDEAITDALAGTTSNCELLPYNLADDGTFRGNSKDSYNIKDYNYQNFNNSKTAYMVVQYGKKSSAVSSLVKVRSNEDSMPNVFKVKGSDYTKISDKISSSAGNWYLYSRSYQYAEPISDISISSYPFERGVSAISEVDFGDATEEKAKKTISKYSPNTKCCLYLHTNKDEEYKYYSDIFIGSGKSKNEAYKNLLAQGATGIIDYDLNKKANGNYVYLGFTRTKDKNIAVKDIIVTKGKPYEETESSGRRFITVDGIQYESMSDVNLNDGTNATKLYLYYTCNQGINSSPYVSLSVGIGDSVPIVLTSDYEKNHKEEIENGIMNNISQDDILYNYERILDGKGKIADLNSGLFASNDGVDMDIQLFLFGAREDKSIKDKKNAKTFELKDNTLTLFGSGFTPNTVNPRTTTSQNVYYGDYKLK